MSMQDLQDRPSVSGGSEFSYQLAVGGLDFQARFTADPAPAGLQILQDAGLRPPEAYCLFAILPSGDFDDIRLGEPLDLRGRGVERLIAFRSDRVFRLTLVGAAILWGDARVSGRVLRELARPGPDEALYLDIPGGADRLIGEEDVLDLSEPGVERVVIGPGPGVRFEIEVIYNGVPKLFMVRRDELVKTLLDAALAAFAPIPNPHTLSIWKGGEELQDGHTLGQSGVKPHDKLLLRPSKVKGGE